MSASLPEEVRGIGRATALAAAKRGYKVVLGYASNKAAADETVSTIEAGNGKAGRHQMRCRPMRADIQNLFKHRRRISGHSAHSSTMQALSDKTVASRRDVGGERLTAHDDHQCGRQHPVARAKPSNACRRKHSGQRRRDYQHCRRLRRRSVRRQYLCRLCGLERCAIDSHSRSVLRREVADEGIRVAAIRPGLIDTDIHASGRRARARASKLAAHGADEARRDRRKKLRARWSG